jgi:hypothetical protein
MNLKMILGLALVVSSGLFGCSSVARADETNAPVSTNAAQSYVTATLKTSWTDAKINLYRTKGGMVQLDAKREVVTFREGPYTHASDAGVLAFVDPETGNAWAGSSFGIEPIEPMFYLETESGILRGTVWFGTVALGAVRPDEHDVINGVMPFGQLNWNRSLVPTVKHGENVDAVIGQLNKDNDPQLVVTGMHREKVTIIQNSLQQVDNGLNAWFFVDERSNPRSFVDERLNPRFFSDERRSSQFAVTMVGAVDVSDGKLRLDLKSPTGAHTASVWIDLNTWKVVKVVQDGKP